MIQKKVADDGNKALIDVLDLDMIGKKKRKRKTGKSRQPIYEGKRSYSDASQDPEEMKNRNCMQC